MHIGRDGPARTASPVPGDRGGGRDRPPRGYPQQLLVENAEHRRKYNKMLDGPKTAYTFDKTPSFTAMIRSSAQWVDAHVPAHDTGETTNGD